MLLKSRKYAELCISVLGLKLGLVLMFELVTGKIRIAVTLSDTVNSSVDLFKAMFLQLECRTQCRFLSTSFNFFWTSSRHCTGWPQSHAPMLIFIIY